ncbi:2,5-didehydrogluconate reductase [Paraburkholderia unamae]|uniref:aldo/keto reductase n=1 Tax=Paraburkholderia unamae TaxID=219649 RepID=UPI001CB51728|nr:aldo/keto reductase [Paraburkholderia unamae]CAG9272922.1 2,5-didehydrogluconate reductase [Paraburkholderia unamae]
MTAMTKTFQINEDAAIPAVGFGTYLIPPDQTATAVRTASSVGYRHIDTAAVYDNEEAVGEGIRAGMSDEGLSRTDIFVTTKLWPGYAGWGEKPKSGTETIEECRASLARLGLEYVDLYLIHSPHGGSARIDQWRALIAIKKLGLARSIGVSNFNQSHLEELRDAGLPMPEANQIELHPWSQKTDLVAYMRANNIAPIAYSSLAPLSTWRTQEGQDSGKTTEMKADDKVFAKIAESYGVSEAQLLLRWGVQNGYAILPKSLNRERMRQNLDLAGFTISDEDLQKLSTMDRGDGIAWSTGDPTRAF